MKIGAGRVRAERNITEGCLVEQGASSQLRAKGGFAQSTAAGAKKASILGWRPGLDDPQSHINRFKTVSRRCFHAPEP